MSAPYRILEASDFDDKNSARRTFALDVLNGLSESPKRLNSKYFYDDRGSQLFQDIMALDEYYLTRSEFEILETNRGDISKLLCGDDFNLVELGAGDGYKTRLLLEAFQSASQPFTYVPIDISVAAVAELTGVMQQDYPDIKTEGLVAEYFDALKWLSNRSSQRNIVLFLGSNIGNFSPRQSRVFLRSLWNSLNDDDVVIIGFDLKKDIELMLKAYNDERGVTREFNLNLLQRINRELGGNFDCDLFRFYASYNVFSGAIESYLVSLSPQEIYIDAIGQSFSFKAWEPIHTEYSYKFLRSDIEQMAVETGFAIIQQFYDTKGFFADSIWRVMKQ